MGLNKRAVKPLNKKKHTMDVPFPWRTPHTTLAFVQIAPSTTIIYNLTGSDTYVNVIAPSKNKYSIKAGRGKSRSCRCIATIRRMALPVWHTVTPQHVQLHAHSMKRHCKLGGQNTRQYMQQQVWNEQYSKKPLLLYFKSHSSHACKKSHGTSGDNSKFLSIYV